MNHDLANSKYFLDVCCKLHAQHRLWSPVWSHDEDLDRPNGSQLLAREDYPGNSQSTWQIPTWQRPTSTKYIEREEKWPTMYFLLSWPWWGDGAILPGNHYCAFVNLVHQCDYLILMKMIIFLIQVGFGEMHWHAISVPNVASYASANVELCTVHFLHIRHSAPLVQCTSCTVHILRSATASLAQCTFCTVHSAKCIFCTYWLHHWVALSD